MGRPRSAAALSRPAVPRHARRVSGPVARPVPVPGQPRARTPVAQPHNTFGATLRALPDHRLLDTLLRSRAWIWLLGISLGGIVFMQVSLLGMNAGIGRAVATSTTLEHRNAQLQETVAELSGDDRVHSYALNNGLVSPEAIDVDYLRARPRLDARRAADRMGPPSPEARAAVAAGGSQAAPAASTTTTSTTAVNPVATVAPTATAAPVTSVATPVPTAAVPVATPAQPVATTAPSTTAGATSAP